MRMLRKNSIPLRKQSVVNIHFVNNEIMRLLRKDYLLNNSNDNETFTSEFSWQTWILTTIYFSSSRMER